MRLDRFALFALVTASLLFAACSPAPTAQPAAPTAAAGAAPAPAARPAGKLTVVTANWGTESFDTNVALTVGAIRYLRLMYDPLVGQTDDGLDSTETGVAEKWEMSPDGKTWTFYVRKGIKFHNGDDLTAEDVKFTIDHNMAPESLASYAGDLRALGATVSVVDPYTVRINLKEPNVFLPTLFTDADWLLAFILPKKYYESKGQDGFRKAPVGSGPYKLVEYVPGNRVVYEAVPQHWRVGVPKYKTVVMQTVEEEVTRIAMLKAGEADIAQIKRESAAELKAAGFVLGIKEGDLIVDLHLHQKWEPPFNNKLVREALSISIPRDELVTQLFKGFARDEGTGLTGRLSYGWQHRPPYPYDPERAKQLLTQAGYPGGKGLKLVLWSMSYSFPEGPDMMQALAGYWSKLGIESEIRPTDFATLRPLWSSRKLPPGSISPMGHNATRRDGLVMVNAVEGTGPTTMSEDPVLNDLIQRGRTELDLKKKAELYGQVEQYLYDNFLHPAIAEISVVWAANKSLPTDWKLGMRSQDVNVEDLARRK